MESDSNKKVPGKTRKRSRKSHSKTPKRFENSLPRHNSDNADICDCQNEECCGCWYECENCGSTKCGAVCRVNRNFYLEPMVFDGR